MRTRHKAAAFAAATIFIGQPAAALRWTAGYYTYPSLADCWAAGHRSCILAGRMIKLEGDAAPPSAPVAGARSGKIKDVVYYRVADDAKSAAADPVQAAGMRSGGDANASVSPVDGTPTSTETGVLGCYTSGGSIHKPPCSATEVKVYVFDK